jgi:hypothetical protein
MFNVPEITVMCSIRGASAAAPYSWRGISSRNMIGTASVGGPSITAIFTPGN